MALIQTVAPTTEPVSLAEIKDHLRLTNTTADDSLLSGYIKVARHQAENYTKRQLLSATWQLKLDDFPSDVIELIRPPLSTASTNVTITYINSTASGSSSTTLSATAYTVDSDSEPGRIYPSYGNDWPTDALSVRHAVTIQFVTGYTSASSVPENIKHWIKMRVGDMYEYRESITTDKIATLPRTYYNGLLDEHVIIDFSS